MIDERTVRTIPDIGDDRVLPHPEPDVLYVALCGDQPMAGGLAVHLEPGWVLVIGRGPELALERRGAEGEVWLCLPDARVSERHAVVDRDGTGALFFQDMGSLNGSFSGDRRLDAPVAIGDGQTVVVGRTVLLFLRRVRDALLGPAVAPAGAESHGMRTLSAKTARVNNVLARAASGAVPVLLRGETGTGKEVAARALHVLSRRRGRFVAVNCGALPESLIESELFGYRRGAFSGATDDRAGMIAAANGGTLLLDELGELPVAAQVKLLRALQEGAVVPLGSSHGDAVRSEFRLVCATNVNLEALVARGRFRADLLARVRGIDLELPPLRDRRMDVGVLVASLLSRHAGAEATSYRFDRSCAEALVNHDYPLNIRELEQALRAMLALAGSERVFRRELLEETMIGRGVADNVRGESDPGRLRAELLDQLQRHQGNISAVARAMRRTRMQVHRWLKRWNIDGNRYRGAHDAADSDDDGHDR